MDPHSNKPAIKKETYMRHLGKFETDEIFEIEQVCITAEAERWVHWIDFAILSTSACV